MNMLISIMMILTTMFMFLNHPISLGSVLMLQTILLAMITGLLNLNFWFSYILFLTMIGGLLILFIYMTSIASNEKFKLSSKMIFWFFSSMLFSLFLDKMFNQNFKLNEMLLFNNSKIINYLNKYFNFPFMNMAIFLMIYLLLTMIIIVKLTKKNFGPIRQIM